MPVDSTFNENESSSEEGRDETVAAQRTPGPPRPPRPGGKRKGSGLIPMPSQQNAGFGQLDNELDAAPGVDIEDDRDGAFTLLSARAQHVEPEESFADIDAELHETAPPAPLSGSMDGAGPVEATPPRAGAAYGREEPEPTLVGKVPENLLELSGAGEENTRAFTAPRELIELARRRREERLDSKAPADAHLRDTQRPNRGAASRAAAEQDADAAPPIPVDSAPPRRLEEDAAPPIARTNSGEMEAVALPPRSTPHSEPRGSGPVIEVEPASEMSISVSFDADSAAKVPVVPASEQVPSRIQSGMSLKPALLVGALFVLVGVVIARWHELMQLLR
jgi:hypothetical protein